MGTVSPPPGPNSAIIVVDVQNDFADPAGALHVHGGEDIIGPINERMESSRGAGATIVATQDWHPPQTPHFIDAGGTWPPHCVRHTWGAELHPKLNCDIDLILRKGTGGEDGYSAFTLVDPRTGSTRATGLAGFLRDRGINHVVVVGLASDVCVSATALDSVASGFETVVPWAETRAVELELGDADRAADRMADAGVTVLGAGG